MMSDEVEPIYCPFDRMFLYHEECYCGFCYNRSWHYPNEPYHQELKQAVDKAAQEGEQWLAAQSPETIKQMKEEAR